MKKLFTLLLLFACLSSGAQVMGVYRVPTVAAMKTYFGTAEIGYVTATNEYYVICSTCTADEISIYAGAGGRKWKRVTANYVLAVGRTIKINADSSFDVNTDTIATLLKVQADSIVHANRATTEATNRTSADALKQNLITLTTTGSSGAATFNQSTGALNIPSYAAGTGTVTNFTATNGTGQTWTITNPTTTPNLSLALTADALTDGTTNKAYTSTEKTKLAGIATGATATTLTNNLTTNSSGTALDAQQGYVLKGLIDANTTNITTNTSSINTITPKLIRPFSFRLGFGGGDVAVATNVTRILAEKSGTITKVTAIAGIGPTGADFVADIKINGTSIWAATPANRIKIIAGATQGSQTSFNTTVITAGDVISIDIVAVGSTVAGQDILIQLVETL